jgi:1,4-dihydroxy-2-naphthoyl-CoA synthase
MGVAHRLHAVGAADQALADMLGNVRQSAPRVIAATKRKLSADHTPTRELIDELQLDFQRLFESYEAVEGRAAFHEKRPPAWARKH